MTDEFENFKCFMQTELNLLHNLSIFFPENDVKTPNIFTGRYCYVTMSNDVFSVKPYQVNLRSPFIKWKLEACI